MRIFKNILLLLVLTLFSCSLKKESLPNKYITENVIVVIIDGARYSETWGDSTHQYIPFLSSEMSDFGVINTNFFNNGPTYTLAGHTMLSTGLYQEINNAGSEVPQFPSFFQYWNKHQQNYQNLSWIISSKDKLEVMKDCQQIFWKGKYQPSYNCGNNGLGSGYREDSTTFNKMIEVLKKHHPKLVLLSFRDPDYSAHTGNWNSYIQGIINTDKYAYQIWDFIQHDSYYKGKTTLFITNDHGRHLDSISDGFISHGDNCQGCRHINLYAYGPDFKKGEIVNIKRDLVDIPATIAELLLFKPVYGYGKVMNELFDN